MFPVSNGMIIFLDLRGVLIDPRLLEEFDEDADSAATLLFDDVEQFLETHREKRLVLVTSGFDDVDGAIIEMLGIRDAFEECIFTNGRAKGEVLAEYAEYAYEEGVIVDDNAHELESIAEHCPQLTPILMERFTQESSLQIHEFDQVTNLAELDALLDALSDDL